MGKSYIVVNDAWYNGSGEGNPAFSALGTISELKIAAQIRSYNDADGEHNPAFMAYHFDDSETWKELELSWFKYQDNDNWFGTPDGTGQVAADGFAALADGDHSIELYFYKPSTAAEGGEHHKIYDNNNGNNFKATFKKGTETPQEITYKVKVPAGTTECWIGGDWEKNGNWTFRQMGTVDAIDHQFELKVENQLASFKYKYCSSNDWDHKELKADGTDMADRTFGDSIDVVAKFKVPAVTEWFIKGSFNGWADGYKLEGTDNKALSVKIALDANKKYEFKILRVNDKDSVWFGLPSAGNNMKYGECTDWVAYKSEGEQNQANVGLISTKAQDYTFTVDVTNTDNGNVAPKFSVDIPEPEGGAASWFVIGSFNEWALGFGLTGTDDKALTAKITVEAKKSYEFKLIHVEGPDTTWYGLPDAGHTMTHTSCTDWVAYKSEGEQNQANVGLQSTKAGEYTFTVDVTNKDNDKIAPKFSVNIPEPDPDVREKREIVLHAGELTGDNACIILFAYTPGKEAFDVNMTLKEGDVFTAQIPKELDSLIIVRAAPGSTWGNLIWDGEGKTAWNQSYDQFIACDTVFFVDWVLETKYFNVSWCSAPEPPATAWYIKLPYGENDWDWHLMVEEEDGTWSHSEKWVGGGANVNTTMSDEGAKYIQDSEMDFGDNKVAPEKGTDCTFIWNATTQKLLVKYTKSEGIENVVYVLDENAPMYNLLGVEVDATFKGVVIQNGHKFIR